MGLDAVNRLRPVSYIYNSNGEPTLGFIAEEAAVVDPRLVVFDAAGRPNALNSDAFIPILTKGLQELDQKVTQLEAGTSAATETSDSVSTQISQALTHMFNQVAEFFQTVVFHGDVIFVGRPIVNKDSAGFAQIPAGGTEVSIQFEKAYQTKPVVVVSPDTTVIFAVEQASPTGFVIKVSQPVTQTTNFSWTATAVQSAATFTGQPAAPVLGDSTVTTPEAVQEASTPTPMSVSETVATESAIIQ